MSEPTPLGEMVQPIPVIRIPKRCLPAPKGCGKEYEGNSLTPLKPGEDRRLHPCDACIEKQEAFVRSLQPDYRDDLKPVPELVRPQRTTDDRRYGD